MPVSFQRVGTHKMAPFFDTLFSAMDSLLITFYRFTGYPLIDYFIGTAILAFLCVASGELSISLALRFNRRHLDSMSAEIKEKERLSQEAHRVGDRESYRALNREATDAWGKQFFTMAAYSAGILFKYLRPRLPYFNRVQRLLDHPSG